MNEDTNLKAIHNTLYSLPVHCLAVFNERRYKFESNSQHYSLTFTLLVAVFNERRYKFESNSQLPYSYGGISDRCFQ